MLAAASPIAHAQRQDADTLVEAVVMVDDQASFFSQARRYCANQVPARKAGINRAAVFWASNNGPEIYAVEAWKAAPGREKEVAQMREQKNAAVNALLQQVKAIKAEDACAHFEKSWTDRSADIAKSTPRASAFLREYYSSLRLPAKALELIDEGVGCLTRSVNAGRDYDASVRSCDCSTNIMFTELSDTERAEVRRRAHDNGSVGDYAPYTRIKPRLAECFR